MTAVGSGAMEWDEDDLPDIVQLSILDVALDPEKYVDEVITLTGYIGESVPPDEMFVSADLRDHPSYGNAGIRLNSTSGQRLAVGLNHHPRFKLLEQYHITNGT